MKAKKDPVRPVLGRTGRKTSSIVMRDNDPSVVMAGLVPAIHVFLVHGTKNVEARA